jgi:hypothetical protein
VTGFENTPAIMKNLFSIAAITAVTLICTGAEATELPSYELMGFPISPHQISVVGSANVKEQSPSTSLAIAGMPASPHQVAVLTPHPRPTEELVTNETVSFSTR